MLTRASQLISEGLVPLFTHMLLPKIHQEPEGPFLGILNPCEFLIALVLAFGPLNQLQPLEAEPCPHPNYI